MRKLYKKVYIFYLTNILKAMILPLALVFGTFKVKSVRYPPDMNQSFSQTICLDIIGLAIALLLADTIFLI